jgi:hypothetical protein
MERIASDRQSGGSSNFDFWLSAGADVTATT